MWKKISPLLLVFLLFSCGKDVEVTTQGAESERVPMETTTTSIVSETTTTTVPPTTTTTTAAKNLAPKKPSIKSQTPKLIPNTYSDIWDRLAQCETGGNWSENSVPGYSGGLGFSNRYWDDFGGTMYAPMPYLASKDGQIAVARKILATNGVSAWPVCGPKVGLTKGA